MSAPSEYAEYMVRATFSVTASSVEEAIAFFLDDATDQQIPREFEVANGWRKRPRFRLYTIDDEGELHEGTL
jgi:hypothetical protein